MFSLLPFLSKSVRGKALEEVSVEAVLKEFALDNETLRRMMEVMNSQFDAGLAGGIAASSIAMLPSYVPCLPDGTESGKYLAVDLGGTNLRTMLYEICEGDSVAHSRNFKMSQAVMTGTGEALFDFIASCLATFLEEKGLLSEELHLGFTFSYPCDQTGIRKSTLQRWTKGFTASDVEGRDVVELLEASLKRFDLKVRVAAILNDTVGTQIAAAQDHKACDIGVIIATGTNASYIESTSKIPKLADAAYTFPKMLIDTEWGGFGDNDEAEFIRTQYDRIVDSRSTHPGRQRFDKLVAGMYMGELVRLVLQKLVRAGLLFNGVESELLFTEGSFPTKFISEILADQSGYFSSTKMILDELGVDHVQFADLLIVREVCIAVSRRSANLAAAATACIVNRLKLRKPTIGIDGSTYRFHPLFHSWMVHKIPELLDDPVEVRLVSANDGSGKGAALVAAIAEKLNLF